MAYNERAFVARWHPQQQQGIRDLMGLLPAGLRMAEIGIYAGESTRLFIESGKIARLYAVDPWGPDYCEDRGAWFRSLVPWEDVLDTFMAFAAGRPEIEVLRMVSTEAALRFADGSLDFVYIDANHSYASAAADIAAWRSKVRPGGWLGGHDFSSMYPGVMRAVQEALVIRPGQLQVCCDTSWLVQV